MEDVEEKTEKKAYVPPLVLADPRGCPLPRGFVSFLYHVINTPDVNREFHTNPDQVMKQFNLPPKLQELIDEAKEFATEPDNSKRKDLVRKMLINHMLPEILASYDNLIW